MNRLAARALGVATVFAVAAGPGIAQTVRVSGRVIDLETGRAVERARVQLMGAGDTVLGAATSDVDGRFVLTAVRPGGYSAVVSAIGYQARRLAAVTVSSSDLDLGDISLLPQVHRLGALVVTASRERESILEAPASVFRVGTAELRKRPTVTVAEHLGGATGVDIVTTGLTQRNVAAPGVQQSAVGEPLRADRLPVGCGPVNTKQHLQPHSPRGR